MKQKPKDDRVIKIEQVGKNFKVTTTSKVNKYKVVEDKTPEEFIKWFGQFSKEADDYRQKRTDLMNQVAGMTGQGKQLELNRKKISEELNKVNSLDELKSHLAEVFSGLKNHNEKLKNAKENIDYLQEQEDRVKNFINKQRAHQVKALRITKKGGEKDDEDKINKE